ncbi:hypothetical protein [Nocardioides sp.]|nr:hypothetical protein [Nocardioides sp.]
MTIPDRTRRLRDPYERTDLLAMPVMFQDTRLAVTADFGELIVLW